MRVGRCRLVCRAFTKFLLSLLSMFMALDSCLCGFFGFFLFFGRDFILVLCFYQSDSCKKDISTSWLTSCWFNLHASL